MDTNHKGAYGRVFVVTVKTSSSKVAACGLRYVNERNDVKIGVVMSADFSSHNAKEALRISSQYALRAHLVQHYDRLKVLLTRRLGCAQWACETLHETWLKLDGSRAVFGANNPDAYIFRMAYHTAIGMRRIEARHRNARNVSLDDPECGYLPDLAPGPEDIVVGRLTLRELSDAVDLLPRRRRAILLASRLEQMTIKDVAVRHGITPAKARAEVRLAQAYCKKAVRADCIGEPGRRGATLANSRDATADPAKEN